MDTDDRHRRHPLTNVTRVFFLFLPTSGRRPVPGIGWPPGNVVNHLLLPAAHALLTFVPITYSQGPYMASKIQSFPPPSQYFALGLFPVVVILKWSLVGAGAGGAISSSPRSYDASQPPLPPRQFPAGRLTLSRVRGSSWRLLMRIGSTLADHGDKRGFHWVQPHQVPK
jgi:hypothetical protein